MKIVAGIIGAALLLIQSTSAGTDYELVWSDEFSGSSINASNWEHLIGTGTLYGLPAGWGNNELQYYTNLASNSFVANGLLHIIARSEFFGGQGYTSARLRTLNRFDFLYGRIEARIKVPSAPGIWPAFWMLPSTDTYGGWAASGEIDIVETRNTPTVVYGTTFYGNQWPNQVGNGGVYAPGIDYSQGFHTYRVEWEPDILRWYVDGVLYHQVSSSVWFSAAAPENPRAPFDQPFHILLNIAVGGNFPGPPNGSVGYPAEMLVDWVRVYQRDLQAPFAEPPIAIPGRVEAEHFDLGGQGFAYSDSDAANNGGAFRPSESVDLEVSAEGGFNVGWIREGEWIEYTVDVQQPGTYRVDVRVASQSTGGALHIEFDGVDITGPMSVPVTGGWQNWTTISTNVVLTAGEQVMRFVNDAADPQGYNLGHFDFEQISIPGDANGDCEVNITDLNLVIGSFGQTISPGSGGDLNGDGEVNIVDLNLVLGSFGAQCG